MRTLLVERLRIVRRQDPDRGAAIVAAIGVMIICMSLGVLIVSQAIASQRDSGRSRARTVEIHDAEAGVDTLHASLQKGEFVCKWETTAGDALGPDGVGSKAELRYWDEDGDPMDCTGDTLVWDINNMPARAQILVTSENERTTMAGIEPKRSFESEVLLQKEINPRVGAAIYSDSTLHPSDSPRIMGDGADVWVNSGDFQCSNGTLTEGHLYVPDGSALLVNQCRIGGDIYALDNITLQNSSKMEGAANARNGNLRLEASTTLVDEGALLGGAYTDRTGTLNGRLVEGHTFNQFHQPTPGLPEVEWNPSDWTGFEVLELGEFAEESLADLQWYGHPADACSTEWTGGVVRTPARATMVNLTGCGHTGVSFRQAEIEVFGDTAIFAKGFNADGLKVRSGDGQEHNLWLIVPKGHSGNVDFNVTSSFSENAPVFVYTPGRVNISNNTAFYGQAYGHDFWMSGNFDFVYKEIGIPGVDLMPGWVDLEGEWNVDVVYKRETGDRVN